MFKIYMVNVLHPILQPIVWSSFLIGTWHSKDRLTNSNYNNLFCRQWGKMNVSDTSLPLFVISFVCVGVQLYRHRFSILNKFVYSFIHCFFGFIPVSLLYNIHPYMHWNCKVKTYRKAKQFSLVLRTFLYKLVNWKCDTKIWYYLNSVITTILNSSFLLLLLLLWKEAKWATH